MPLRKKQIEPITPEIDFSDLGYTYSWNRKIVQKNVKRGTGVSAVEYGFESTFYWAINACERLIIDQLVASNLRIEFRGREIKPRWLNSPSPYDDRDSFLSKCARSILRDGNIFAQKSKVGNKNYVVVFNPFTINVEWVRDEQRLKYTVGETDKNYVLPGEELTNVVHKTKGLLPGEYRGLGLVPILEDLFEIGTKSKLHHKKSLDLLRSLMVLNTNIDVLNGDQRKVLQNSIASSFNVDDVNATTVMALAKDESVSYPIASVKTDLISSEKTVAAQIASLYGIDYVLLNILMDNSSDTYSNESDKLYTFNKLALEPVGNAVADFIKKCIGVSGVEVWFDSEEFTEGNQNEQAEQLLKKAQAAKRLFDAGYSKEEINRILDWEEDEDHGEEIEPQMRLALDIESEE